MANPHSYKPVLRIPKGYVPEPSNPGSPGKGFKSVIVVCGDGGGQLASSLCGIVVGQVILVLL